MIFDLLRQVVQIFLDFFAPRALDVVVPVFVESKPVVEQPSPVSLRENLLGFATPKEAWHAVRVMCDAAGLTFTQKNILCACVYQESNFYNFLPSGKPVRGTNHNADGSVSSTDWGIVQINDYWHIGPGKDFPSVEYVLGHPEKAVAYMIAITKRAGYPSLWSSYTSGAYKKWVPFSSPMWALAAK